MKKIIVFGCSKTTPVKESNPQDYISLFMHEVGITARSGKTACISKEHHERITKIIQIIGKNEVSLFSFLDNVPEHHFATYQGELNELYENSIDKSF